MSWQPIESAPHGIKVLVWGSYNFNRNPDVGVFTAWVNAGHDHIPTRVYLDPSPHDDEYSTVELVEVTHWMPLPEPPK